ncbi:MAG: proteasome assembly chaperone family protein [Thaumarchaeota archaeon]|nr:proteasome assembly chaperone family protein [Nitrososphaerota archaeon]
MSEEMKIVERDGVKFSNPVVIEGLPDVGLVGTIAATHMVELLGLEQVAHFESNLFPPIMVMHKGVLTDPVRILGNEKLLVVTSEIAIPPVAIYPLASVLVDWLSAKGARLVVSLTGFPEQNRLDIDKPLVFGVGNMEQSVNLLKEKGVEVMSEGFIAGIYALILKYCMVKKIPAITLMAQAFPNYPDPGAAAQVLQVLNNILGLNVSVDPLLEKADEIKIKARDLMMQTRSSLERVGKMSEQQIPLMYR